MREWIYSAIMSSISTRCALFLNSLLQKYLTARKFKRAVIIASWYLSIYERTTCLATWTNKWYSICLG